MKNKLKLFFWHTFTSIFVIFEDVPDSLDSLFDYELSGTQLKIRSSIFFLVIICWLGIILIFVYSTFYFMSRPTFFIVTANVEQVSISPYNNQEYPSFKFISATLYPDCSENSVKVTGTLYPAASTYMDFLRIQRNDLIINLDNEVNENVGVFITSSNTKIDLDDCASIKVKTTENSSFIFPIHGDIQLGGGIKEGAVITPILYSGEVSIVDKALLTRVYYSVGPFKFQMGDVFSIDGSIVKSSGFVQVDNEKGIKVTYSSKGNKGYIKRYRTENIIIQNGFWTKIYNDQSLIILWFFSLFLFALCKARIRINLTKLNLISV